jgi:hypothetical protein
MTNKLTLLLLFSSATFAQGPALSIPGCNGLPITGTGWTSSTSVNATQILASPVISPQILVTLDQGTTLTGGVVTFLGDYGDGNFVTVPVTQVLAPSTGVPLTNPYTLVASTNQPFLIIMNGFVRLQLKLTTAITGSATVTPYTVQLCYNPSTVALGQAAMASSFPVVVASNQSTLNVAGTGTAGTSGTAALTVQGITSGTPVPVSGAVSQTSGPWTQNITQVDGSALGAPSNYGTSPGAVTVPGVNAFVTNTPAVSQSGNWTARVVGNTGSTLDSAPQATAPTNVIAVGAAAVNAEQTAATNGQAQRVVTDLVGKQIFLPYANPENFLQATANATGTGSTAIFSSAGGSLRNYVTSCQINNTSSTNTFVNLEDGSTVLTVIPAPANEGAIIIFPVPLRGTAATAFNFVAGAGVTTMYVSCQGYKGL